MNKSMFQTRIVSLLTALILFYYSIAMTPLAVFAYEVDDGFGASANRSFFGTIETDEDQEEATTPPEVDHEIPIEEDHDSSEVDSPNDDSEKNDAPTGDGDFESEHPFVPENDDEDESAVGEMVIRSVFRVIRGPFESTPIVRLPEPRISINGSRVLPDETPRAPAPRPEPGATEPEGEPANTEPISNQTSSGDSKDGTGDLPQTGAERVRPWLFGLGLLGASGAAIYFKNKQD